MRAVRALEGGDADALQLLLESLPSYSIQITGYPPGPSDALSALISVPPYFDRTQKIGLGLWEGDMLVGFADVLLGYPEPAVAYIGLLAVHRDRQRRGLGRELHEGVVSLARQTSGVDRLRLGTVATTAPVAEPFWSALAYRPTGEVKPYVYDHLSSTVAMWERKLSS